MDLILASTSSYRKALLERLQISFRCLAPNITEAPLPAETPADLARRLAHAKAAAVADRNPSAVVIGSDQVAICGDRILGKPGGAAVARQQLQASSGRQVLFYTSVAVLAPDHPAQVETLQTAVCFRTLTAADIERYLHLEAPWDCAGSFKAEALGITLFERITGDDPTALEGLPLILTARLLRAVGLDPLRL